MLRTIRKTQKKLSSKGEGVWEGTWKFQIEQPPLVFEGVKKRKQTLGSKNV